MDEFDRRVEKGQRRRDYTESYLSAMKRRLNLQMIGAYIRDGSDKAFVSNDGFRDREADAYERLEKMLTEKYGKEEKNIMPHINAYTAVIQEIYFSLGMKAGATLHCKLTDNFETDM